MMRTPIDPSFRLSASIVALLAIVGACTRQESSAAPVTKSASDGAPTAGAAQRATEKPSLRFATVERASVSSTIKLPARLVAWQEVSLYPKVTGYVKQVLVDVGSSVRAGDVLMVLEAPELEQAQAQARERFAKAMAEYTVDREHLARLTDAARTAGAVSPLDLSTLRARVAGDSAVVNAERANWDIQQTMMRYLRVAAPFAGIITERNVHPGALVSSSVRDRPMLELKVLSRLRLQLDVPEEVSVQMRQRDSVTFVVSAFPGRVLVGHIDRRSRNISAQMRTERTEVDVDNSSGVLAPGMYADVLLYTKGNTTAFTVPATSVVTSTERKYVLAVRQGVIEAVDVRTGNQANGNVEVYGALTAGERVIANATAEIAAGSKVQ